MACLVLRPTASWRAADAVGDETRARGFFHGARTKGCAHLAPASALRPGKQAFRRRSAACRLRGNPAGHGLETLFDNEQRFPVFHGLPIFHEDGFDHAAVIGFDFIKQFHGFNNTHGISWVDRAAYFNEWLGARG